MNAGTDERRDSDSKVKLFLASHREAKFGAMLVLRKVAVAIIHHNCSFQWHEVAALTRVTST